MAQFGLLGGGCVACVPFWVLAALSAPIMNSARVRWHAVFFAVVEVLLGFG